MGNFPKLPKGTKLAVGSHQTTIVEYLSEGGFAHIYKVQIDPPEAGSDIACLKRVIVPDKNGLNQLRKEVDVMKTLREGRNIVRYYDSHAERLDGSYQVLVLMELCPNKSLLDYMNARIKTKLSEPEILKIMLDISQGIYEMHKLKLIHRDIKIENVLIDANNQFKLCDFGSTSSRIMPPQDQREFQLLSHDILYQTTPQYRSPEMIDLYKGIPIDEKSDIWALGCFLYKLCYYTTPFEANGDVAILHALFHFPQQPQYSGDLKNLIIIMLQENPLFRPNIAQVIMLICKISKVDFNELGIEDFYQAGEYNFQALHEYQRHKQQEMVKQQMYQQQQQQLLSQHPSAVNLQKVAQPSRSDTPHLKAENSGHDQNLNEHYPTQSNVKIVVPDGDKYEKSLKSSKSGASVQSVAKQNSSNYVDLGLSDLDNLDNVELRYPSLDDFLEAPSKPLGTSVDGLSRKASGDKATDDISREQQLYQSQQSKEANKNSSKAPSFYEKEAWEKLQSNLNDEAVKLVDDIFSSGSGEVPSKKNSFSSSHSVKSSHDPKTAKENAYLQQQHDDEVFDTDLDNFSENIDAKFPVISDEVISRIVTREEAKAENFNQKSSQPNNSRKSFESTLPLKNSYSTGSPVYSPPLPAKDLSVKTLPASHGFSLNTPANQAGDNLNNTVPHSYPKPNFEQYNLNPANNSNSVPTKHNPFPLPTRNQESSKVQESEGGDESKRYANPWGEYRNKSQSKITTVPPPSTQSYQSVPLTSSKLHENLETLNISQTNVVHTPLPEMVEQQYPMPPRVTDSLSEPNPQNAVNSDAPQYPTQSTFSGHEDMNVPTYQHGSVDLNDVNMKLRNKSTEGTTQTPTYGMLNLNESRKVRKQSGDEFVDVNLIDLDLNGPLDSSVGTPIMHKQTHLEEPSLLDLDAEEEKKQEKIKKRISSIQDQKWEEEVIDFASDDENPVNNSRMNRLSIRSSLRKPKRKSGEIKRSESLNYDGKPEILY